MSESWREVSGWNGQYEVSSLGRVRRVDGDLLGQWKNHNGYLLVRLSGPRRTVRVHRLVAEAFLDNPNSKPFVNHLDCDRANNSASNLEWCTQLENLRHSESLGRMQRDYWRGKRSPSAGLNEREVIAIREMYGTGEYSWESLGRLFGVHKGTIGRVVRRKNYRYVSEPPIPTDTKETGE